METALYPCEQQKMCRVLEIIYKNIFADGGWSHLVESVEKLSVVHNGESTFAL